jgi:DNA replication protein DnaC/RNAse (barnase) inhibitor barstar
MNKIINYLFSYYAIIVYLVILLVLFIFVIFKAIDLIKIRNKDIEDEVNSKNKELDSSLIKEMDKKLNKSLNYMKEDLVSTQNALPTGPIISSTEEAEEAPEPDNGSRFYMLTHIDNVMQKRTQPTYNDSITLSELCEEFRNFASYKLHLYYDIKDIRRFISGLAVTKLILLQGMSGTGKTSLAYAFGEYLNNKTVVVPIQPMWKERTDLIGYYNEFTKKFNETTLLNKMYEANYTKDIYITVLDEMNIARVEYYFAEFLSLLELPNPEGRNLDVVSDVWENDPKLLKDGKLRLPVNMWFIGTANNDDSTFAISDKVYDRAMVLNLDKKAEPFDGKPTKSDPVSVIHIYELFKKAQLKNSLSQRNRRRLNELDKYLIETFSLTFGNRIMKQIEQYVPVVVECGGTELDALDDIISRKILRKLESKNPVYVRSQSEALINKINDLFGDNKLAQSIEQIRHLEQNS